jgi:hypothetical protein
VQVPPELPVLELLLDEEVDDEELLEFELLLFEEEFEDEELELLLLEEELVEPVVELEEELEPLLVPALKPEISWLTFCKALAASASSGWPSATPQARPLHIMRGLENRDTRGALNNQ